MTNEMKYDLMSPEQVKKALGQDMYEFQQSDNELSLYHHPELGVTVAKWVDDLITRGPKENTEKFWVGIEKRFNLKSRGYVTEKEPRVFCGKKISMEKKKNKKWYSIDMTDDMKQWLKDMGVMGMRPVQTPMKDRQELYSDMRLLSEEEATAVRSKMGSLQYYCKEWRWDCAAAVNIVAQTVKEPTEGTKKALDRILAYLVGTADHKLWVARVKGTKWDFYVDSDHAGERKWGDSRSRTGIMLLCNGMPFHWRSTKQPDTAMSSAAAEIVAMSECMKDVNLRLWIAEEAGIKVIWPAEIKVDNAAGVSFQNNMNPDSKLKGVFDMRLDWLKQLHDKKKFRAIKVATEKNLADALTKPLAPVVKRSLEVELGRILELRASGPI